MPLFISRITNHWAGLLGRAIGRYPHSTIVPAIWHNYSYAGDEDIAICISTT